MNIIMAVIGLVGLKRAPECIKTHHFEMPKFFWTTFLDTGLSCNMLHVTKFKFIEFQSVWLSRTRIYHIFVA